MNFPRNCVIRLDPLYLGGALLPKKFNNKKRRLPSVISHRPARQRMDSWRCSCDTSKQHKLSVHEPLLGVGSDETSATENQSVFHIENRNDDQGGHRVQPVLKKLELQKLLAEAAKRGRVPEMKQLLNICPESVMEDTPTRGTALHTAVRHGQTHVVRFLVEWLKERISCYKDVINRKDYCGHTVLHLATSRKQLQTLKLLLEDNPTNTGILDVNAMNDNGFTALDMLDFLPEHGEADMEIKRILQKAGARKGRNLVTKKFDKSNRDEIIIQVGKKWHRPLPKCRPDTNPKSLTSMHHAALITATLLAIMTFHAALRAPWGSAPMNTATNDHDLMSTMGSFQGEKQEDQTIKSLFVVFNSLAFFTSVAFITILLHDLTLKPWLLICVFSTVGAYMCLIIVMSPHQVVTVLSIGCSVLLVTFLNCLALHHREDSS